jgi:hypothetical protein
MRKLEKEELLKRFNIVHNYKFDYSLMDYKDINSKITIICPIHGAFDQTVKNHLQGNKCFECSKRDRSKTTEEFIKQGSEVHDNFYDYSLINYKNYLTPITIICPIHGEFSQLPQEHISGSGCKKCGVEKTKKFTVMWLEKFIEKSNIVHDNKYDYSESDYVNSYTKVKIICPKHGIFFQAPQDHIHSKSGCPSCKESKGEILVAKILQSFNVDFDRQKTFKDLKHKKLLYYDFYLPEYSSCIEYDGEQHFKSVPGWGGEENLYNVQFRDLLKDEYCITNNIPLLRLSYKNCGDDVLSKISDFLKIK